MSLIYFGVESPPSSIVETFVCGRRTKVSIKYRLTMMFNVYVNDNTSPSNSRTGFCKMRFGRTYRMRENVVKIMRLLFIDRFFY